MEFSSSQVLVLGLLDGVMGEIGSSVIVVEFRSPVDLGEVLEVVREDLGLDSSTLSLLHDDVDVFQDLEGFLPEFEVVGILQLFESDLELILVGFGVVKIDDVGDLLVVGIADHGLDDLVKVASHGFAEPLEFDLSVVGFTEFE